MSASEGGIIQTPDTRSRVFDTFLFFFGDSYSGKLPLAHLHYRHMTTRQPESFVAYFLAIRFYITLLDHAKGGIIQTPDTRSRVFDNFYFSSQIVTLANFRLPTCTTTI